ncbi:MAG: hypothetical protein JWM20_360 [Patescibacteria group bacterium]|nr:hypothetical protein [Patescibacteria group bacterium]
MLAIPKPSAAPIVTQNEPNVPLNQQVVATPTPVNQQVSPTASSQAYPLVAAPIEGDAHLTNASSVAQNNPANFAGHYEILLVGCGTGCGTPYLYDKNTDTFYALPSIILEHTADPDGTVPQNYSVSGNQFTIRKKNSAGVIYNERWMLTANGFVKS